MNQKRVCCVINAGLSQTLLEGVAHFRKSHGDLLSVKVHYVHEIDEERVSPTRLREDLLSSELVLLDLRGAGRAVGLAASALGGARNTVVCLVGASPEILSLLRMGSLSLKEIMAGRDEENGSQVSSIQRIQKIMRWVERAGDLAPIGRLRHARNWSKVTRYWGNGGAENVESLLVFLGREYLALKLPAPPEPLEYPELGLYDLQSGKHFDTLEAYRAHAGFLEGRPTVGLFFYGGMHFSQSVVAAEAVARHLGSSCNLVPVYSTSLHNLEAIEKFYLPHGRASIDVLLYLQWFQLATFSADDPEKTLRLLGSLNVPVFAGAPLYGRELEKWEESDQGLSPVEVMTTVIMPELDGMIEPVPSLALKDEVDPGSGEKVKRPVALEAQVARISRRMLRRAALKEIANAEKRVAFIIYNNPPGEDNIGNAAYLDVFASLRRLVSAMADRGYRVEPLPESREICRRFIDIGAVNNARWVPVEQSLADTVTVTAERYENMLASLPHSQEVVSTWGRAPGEIMAGEGKIVLPGLELGNVFLGLQPARGIHSDPGKLTHDKSLPPHHQYIAFYKWLEEDWRADAVVHVGTHGTLEFLKGKEVGMSPVCYPALLIGSVPHFYIYHVVNPSEAMIAKRRSLGTIVSYNSPPLTVSGLYEDYAILEEWIDEYLEAKLSDPGRGQRLEARILEKASSLSLTKESVPEIQEELVLMKRSIIPKGLHILDEELSLEDAAETITCFLRYDRDGVPSLHRLLAEEKGLDHDGLLDRPEGLDDSGRMPAETLQEIEANARELVLRALQGATDGASDAPRSRALAEALKIHERMNRRQEISSLLDALEGGFTMPGIGGEPIRDLETLPTGRNTFQFDPRLVPSQAACERGFEIAQNTLRHYCKLNGCYPRSTGIILWAFETAKTRGETVGQIFGYLGVRPVRKNPWKTDIEIIPVETLGRPRIDVTVQICGFFRDMFMNVVHLVNRAIDAVSRLDEAPEDNYVRVHSQQAAAGLSRKVGGERAAKLASARVFGPRPGEYGTRVTSLIETASWTSEEELVETFTSSMNHLYGENVHGERFEGLYEGHLRQVQMVSQIRDTIDYEIGDLDHYYEYFGGLSRTIESFRGSPPVQLITDTTRERVRTETVGEALGRSVRTRLLNPRWIDALLEHEVHGAQKIGDRVEYLIGFAATTHAVGDWVFSAVAQRYLFDERMRNRLRENNPYAAEEMARRLLEARNRGYWNASEEEREKLRDILLEMEGDLEEST
ncbi:MAG: magnesium chelatase subunit H [Syntrophobacteraceae bacterium]|jgi:cobaltochelatase CobN|nr:magnesium chelatase subunit H [Syntrophobacteraceae bacterium]